MESSKTYMKQNLRPLNTVSNSGCFCLFGRENVGRRYYERVTCLTLDHVISRSVNCTQTH